MKNRIFLFLFFFIGFLNADISLFERLKTAKPNDYVVTEAQKMITLLSIRSINSDTIVFEEITVPTQNLKKKPESWANWIKAKAPGHTSWTMFEIDLKTGELIECFSFSKSAWIQLSQKENLIAQLLHLPLKEVPEVNRRKIGPPPLLGEPDFRKNWNPPFSFEGKKRDVSYDVYEAVWPKDSSELSNQNISIYFDKNEQVFLPIWIQVQTSHVAAALRTIDSGKNLPVIYRNIPRRVPEFVGLPRKSEKELLLNLKTPKYYKEFELYAIDVTKKEKHIFPVTHSLVDGKEEWKTVKIDLEELEHTLEPDHKYTWLLVPIGHSESYTETSKPFVWSSNLSIHK